MVLPHYAAILAQTCQVGLQMDKQSFYNALLKHRVFNRSIEAALGALEVHMGSIACLLQFDVLQPVLRLDNSPL